MRKENLSVDVFFCWHETHFNPSVLLMPHRNIIETPDRQACLSQTCVWLQAAWTITATMWLAKTTASLSQNKGYNIWAQIWALFTDIWWYYFAAPTRILKRYWIDIVYLLDQLLTKQINEILGWWDWIPFKYDKRLGSGNSEIIFRF